jgi:curved DNA-binding protein CbpA
MTEDIDKEFSLQLFGLSSSSSLVELKKKYRELIKLYHPDTHPEKMEWATRMVQQLNDAYRVILVHLGRITSAVRLEAGQDEETKCTLENYRSMIDDGDEALRDAVVVGWLKRTPRDVFAHTYKRRIERALRNLTLVSMNGMPVPEVDSYMELFSVFLEATVEKSVRPLPALGNPTRFLRHLSSANKYLDSGIRNFYHYRDSGSLRNLGNIPFSFLEDSIRTYGMLVRELDDRPTLRLINARMKLARLFQTRIRDPERIMSWQ